MPKFIRLFPAVLAIIACNPSNEDAANPAESTDTAVTATSGIARPTIAFRITERDLITEGIAYSAATNRFFVSSVFKTKIVQVDGNTGAFEDFIGSDLLGLGVLGMIVDDARGFLWACANSTGDDRPVSTIAKFDIFTGELVASFETGDTIRHTYNDLVLDSDGNVYFTDTQNQTVGRIDHETNAVEVFFAGTEIEYPNGITISPDDRYLYVASWSQGIRVIDIENARVVGDPDTVHVSTGIDGLKYHEGSLYAIQNDVPDPSLVGVLRYVLNAEGTGIAGMEVIDRGNELFDVPTTFVLVGNEMFLVANTQLANYGGGRITDTAQLRDYLIVKYDLQ